MILHVNIVRFNSIIRLLFDLILIERLIQRFIANIIRIEIHTPGLHNKIPAYNIFARGWVAQEPICS